MVRNFVVQEFRRIYFISQYFERETQHCTHWTAELRVIMLWLTTIHRSGSEWLVGGSQWG